MDSYFGWAQSLFVGIGSILIAVAGALYAYQDKLLFIPVPPGSGLPKAPGDNPKGHRSPSDHGIPYEDVFIKTADGVTIHSWLMLQPNSKEFPTLLFFHGNAGNIGFRLPNARLMYEKSQVNIMMVDYRGYGNSEGVPTEEGLVLDAEAALDALRSHRAIDADRVVVFGRSLGGAVALALAHSRQGQQQVAGLVLENTFLDISRMVDVVMPLLAPLKSLVLRLDWPSAKRVGQLREPMLFLSGGRDELVPPSHMQELHSLATQSSQRHWHVVEDGTHNDTWYAGGAAYYMALRKFLHGLPRSTGSGGAGDEVLMPAAAASGDAASFAAGAGERDSIPTMRRSYI